MQQEAPTATASWHKRGQENSTAADGGAAVEDLRRRYLLRRFWRSAGGFWSRRGKRLAWLLSGALLIIILANLATSYGMNLWNRAMFDALQQRDSHAALLVSLIYFPLLAVSVFVMVMQVNARMTLQRRWRAWLNDHLVDRWLKDGRYYQLNLVGGDHANPEYRIADDVRTATESPVEFVTGLTAAVLSALTFIAVLWSIGGALTLHIGGATITIPGFLVVAAVLYALIASGSMVLIGRSFVAVSENKNQREATYRYVLTRLRENGESIALIHGEEEERHGVDRSLRAVLRAWRDMCVQTMRTTIVSQTSSYIAPVLPVILCAPKFLDGTMSLGEVMQAASAFTIVQAAFNWLVDNYPRLSDWTASARRVASLAVSLDGLEAAQAEGFGHINHGTTSGAALRLRNVSVTLNDGTAMISEAEVAIRPGERVLVAGESGTGKSTLVRAIAGLWPWGAGDIEIQEGAKLFLLPQRPYLPIGTLRRAVTYPDAAEGHGEKEIATAMEKVGLEYLVERLEEEGPWDNILSGGEKQRLAFARILLHRPDIVVLDEATSALDPDSQETLMNLFFDELAQATVISVGHRPELETFHNRRITLEHRPGGAKLVGDVPLAGARRRWRDRLRRRKRPVAA